MFRGFVVAIVAVALVGLPAGAALASHHPGWDPSVGYNPGHIAKGPERANKEGGKEAAKAFAPAAGKPAEKSAPRAAKPGTTAWPAAPGWRPYQHPHPVGN